MLRVLFPLLLLSLGGVGTARASGDDAVASFEQRIRPVLVEHCYECHSAGSKKLKGGLRLDTRVGGRKGGETRPAIIPGNPGASLLLEAVSYRNADLQMPPKGRLPDAVIADLTAWIAAGAVDPREEAVSTATAPVGLDRLSHWAFQPIQTPLVPAGPEGANPVDRFLGERLREAGLSLSPPADRRTLIRRAAYDLTGLPPSPEAIDRFLNDPAPDAFERMIERFLDSPRYGERWGRWWLDLARYADTNGQDENKVMANAWRYRDWVIRSFNDNQPFDQFITHQVAGDLLPTNGVSESEVFRRWTATGFLVLGPKMLAEQDKPKLVMDLVDEQIDVTTRAFLGLTVGCARCHDHKFDPIPARDYYALAGIFKSTKTMANLGFVSKFNERPVSTAEDRERLEAAKRRLRTCQKAVDDAQRDAAEGLRRESKEIFPQLLSAVSGGRVTGGTEIAPRWTNAIAGLRGWWSRDPGIDPVSRGLHRLVINPEMLRTFLASSIRDPASTNRSDRVPGRVGAAFAATGRNFLEIPHSDALEPAQLTVEAWVKAPEFPKAGDARRWLVSKSDNEEVNGHYALMLDGGRAGAMLNVGGGREKEYAVWSADGLLRPGRWHHLAFTYDATVLRLYVDGAAAGELEVHRARTPGRGPLTLGRRADGFVYFKGLLDEARVYSRAMGVAELREHALQPERVDSPREASLVARWEFNDLSETEQAALDMDATREAILEDESVLGVPRDVLPRVAPEVRAVIVAREKERDAAKAEVAETPPMVLAVEEDRVVNLPIHLRGSHLNLAKDPVPRGFLHAAAGGKAPAPSKDRSGRLELAGWLTSESNPLTARVTVNRVWQAHFGEGLVRTPDNFGLRGEPPSHPELLDWLATEFRRSGWDLKHVHRLLLTSAAWRQSGLGGLSEALQNRGVGKDPENRLLWHFPRQRLEAEMVRDAVLSVSGRLDAAVGGSLVNWKNDEYAPADEVSASAVRRSVYLPIVRDRVYDVFTLFDFANPSVGTAKRIPTVVSHQSLFFLNSPLVKESARSWVTEWIRDSPPERVRRAYERAFGRPPTPVETQRALEFVARVQKGREGASERSAWSAWCQMLFAANEFVYRE